MSTLIRKSANHLYEIFKVYLALAILGALAIITYELLLSKPFAIIIVSSSLVFLASIVMLVLRVITIHTTFGRAKRAEDIVKKYPGLS